MLYVYILILIICVLFYRNDIIEHFETETNIRSDRKIFSSGIKKTVNSLQNVGHNIGGDKTYAETPIYLWENPSKQNVILDTPNSYIVGKPANYYKDISNTEITKNQRLVGTANPRTLIAPVIAPPSHDLNYWKTSNYVNHSSINTASNTDVYLSGYVVSDDCKKNKIVVDSDKRDIYLQQSNVVDSGAVNTNSDDTIDIVESYVNNKNSDSYVGRSGNQNYMQFPNEPGQLNRSCGYNVKNLNDNLPVNLPTGICNTDEAFDEFNNNIFVNTVAPGVYSKSQIIEPINSNIGISFTQQILPATYTLDNNDVNYTLHDPTIFDDSVFEDTDNNDDVNVSNVYDPRFSGYGTSYRGYVDNNVGQPRYYYKDVDSVKMPNYICRSNIDFLKAADSYGPIDIEKSDFNNSSIRDIANQAYLDSVIEQRTGLQERLMRKINANAWQQRIAPISKRSQVTMGGATI